MEVTSYLIEEHVDVIFDREKIDEWKAVAEELGLEGQLSLLTKEKSMMPFPAMSEAERVVYGDIFDSKQNYHSFNSEAIPLKILSLISLCEKEKYFDKIQIWNNQEIKDPIVIGMRYSSENDRLNGYSWNMSHYMIGAWGEKLLSLAKLLPLWDDYKRKRMKDNYEQNLSSHVSQFDKFKFQVGSFVQKSK